MMDIQQQIEQVRAALEKATPGEWYWKKDCILTTDEACLVMKPYCDEYENVTTVISGQDAELIVCAHNTLPAVLAHIDTLRAELKQAQERAERELTIDDLKAMNDERVVVKFPELDMAVLVSYDSDEWDGDTVWLTNNIGGRSTYETVIEQGGVVWGRGPKGEGNEIG